MKPNSLIVSLAICLLSWLSQGQLFQQPLPPMQDQFDKFDRFEQMSSEPPAHPNVQDLLAQAQNLVNSNRGLPNKMNVLEPPRSNPYDGTLSFLAKSREAPNVSPPAFEPPALQKPKEEARPSIENKESGIIIDGEKYNYNELKDIIQFNKRLVKLCKVDFSACFDIKKSILPKRNVLDLLTDGEVYEKKERPAADNFEKSEETNGEDFGANEIDQKIEDDMIDLGLK